MAGNETLYPVELEAVDIKPYRAGNTGIEYVTSLASGGAGPHVLVSAPVPGNQVSRALVPGELMGRGLRPAPGRPTVMFAQTPPPARFAPPSPLAPRLGAGGLHRGGPRFPWGGAGGPTGTRR